MNWDEAFAYIKRRYLKQLTLEEAIVAIGSNHRFMLRIELPRGTEVYAGALNFRPLAIRAIQGHEQSVVADHDSTVGIRRTVSADPYYTPVEYTAGWRPRVSGYFHLHSDDIEPKVLYHYTTMDAALSMIMSGMFPGGLEGKKPFVFLSRHAPWKVSATSDQGMARTRPAVLIIDVEMIVQEGFRLVETESGHYLSPDWISNKYILAGYDQQTCFFFYANQAYGHLRKSFNENVEKCAMDWQQEVEINRADPRYELPDPFVTHSVFSSFEDAVNEDYERWCDHVDFLSPTILAEPSRIRGVYHQLDRTPKDQRVELQYSEMPVVFRIHQNRGAGARMMPKNFLPRAERFNAEAIHPLKEGMKNIKWRSMEMLAVPDLPCPRCRKPIALGLHMCFACGLNVGTESDMAKASYLVRLEEVGQLLGFEISLDDVGTTYIRGGFANVTDKRGDRSILAVLIHHARDYMKKIRKSNFTGLIERMENDAFFFFNMAQQAMSPKCIVFLERLANAELPQPKRSYEQRQTGVGPKYSARSLVIPGETAATLYAIDEFYIWYRARILRINQFAPLYGEVDPNDRFQIQGFFRDFISKSTDPAMLLVELSAWAVEELRQLVPGDIRVDIGEVGNIRDRGQSSQAMAPGTVAGYGQLTDQFAEAQPGQYSQQEWQDYHNQWTREEWDRWTQQRSQGQYRGYKWDDRWGAYR